MHFESFSDPNGMLSLLGGATTPPMDNSFQDPKTALNTFCQKFCKKAISKMDIVYTVQKFGSEYQATVKLNCSDGIEFAGEVAPNQKEAEKNAARQAIMNFAVEMANLPPSKTKSSNKRKAEPEVDPSGENPKVVLNTALMRILHRALNKDDVVYSTVQTALGFQCTISMPALPGDWGGLAWAGEVANKKKEAEQHAARHAVTALRADPQMLQAMETPPSKVPKTAGRLTANGGGLWGAKGWGKGWGKAWSQMQMMMMKGWGKGCGGCQINPGPRERITGEPVTGTITEWKERYGWVSLHQLIDHPAASKNQGRVYLNIKDWTSPEAPPAANMSIHMQLYADQSGLGAEEAASLE